MIVTKLNPLKTFPSKTKRKTKNKQTKHTHTHTYIHIQQLEQDLNDVDIKIGLLIKNRIELDAVVEHSRRIKELQAKGSQLLSFEQVTGSTTGLKSLKKV